MGYKREEFYSPDFDFFTLIAPESRDIVKKSFSKHKKGEEVHPYEYTLVTKEGKRVEAIITTKLIEYEREIAILGIVTDITERKRSEMALKESEMRYRGVVENANDAIYVITLEGFGYVNPAFEKLTGYKAKEACNKKFNFWNIIHPDDIKLIKEREGARKRGEKIPSRYEFRIIAKGGRARSVEATTVNMGKKGEVKVMGILRDITEKRKAEEQLKTEREQLLSIFEGIDEPIYITDPETYEILYANNSLRRAFGEDIIGKNCYKTFQKLDRPCDFCTNDKILGKNFGKTCVWEWQNLVNKRWYRCIDRGIRWPDGRKVRFEIAVDITDRKKAEGEMKRALEQERRFKLETAHHFFNPIAIAKGFLDLTMEEVPKEQKKKLKFARHAIGRVEKVVKNVIQKGEIRE